jgi:VWFA-related protein
LVLALCTLYTVAGAPADSAENQPAATSRLLEKVLVERIVWPVRLKPLTTGGCDQLEPSQVLVREDGEPAEVTAVEPHDLSTLHVLLIDTSGSMMGLFSYTRTAAEEYIRALPAGHSVMLATFDEDLRLWSPPTQDREALLAALSRIKAHPESNTALWDAVFNTLRYLEWEEARKVLVLLTDGCDSLSLPDHTHQAVLEQVITSRHLTVFPVSMSNRPFPGARTHGCFDPRNDELKQAAQNLLEPLARRSGGELIISQGQQGIGRAFRQVLNRLSQEGSITYSALPFGEGPEDSPRKELRWRRVKVKDAGLKTCSVSSAGPSHRRVQQESPPAPVPPAEIFETHEAFQVLETTDLTLSRGYLYDADIYRATGRLMLDLDRDPRLGARVAGVLVPPLGTLRKTAGQPHLLLSALLDACLEPEDCLNPSGRMLPLVAGQTFFTLRPRLGRLLLAQPDYGHWARSDIMSRRRDQVAVLLDEAGGDLGLEARTLVEETLLGRPFSAGEIQSRLSVWLGDLSAAELAADLEVHASRGPLTRQRLRRQWPQVATWFHPPTSTRTLTMLVPGYDPQRDAVGYYRVHLPRTSHGSPEDLIPPRPMATRILDWAHGPEGLSGLRRQAHELASVRYHPPPEKRVVEIMLRSQGAMRHVAQKQQGWSVTVQLVPAGEKDDLKEALTLVGYFVLGDVLPRQPITEPTDGLPQGWEDLFCLVPAASTAGTPAGIELIRDLKKSGRLCPHNVSSLAASGAHALQR